MKSPTFLLEEEDKITRGTKPFLLFLLAKLKYGMPDLFLNLCMWPFACLSSEAKVWNLYCRIIFGTNWAELWKPTGKATFWEIPYSKFAVCNRRASWLSCLEKLVDPMNASGDLWYLYSRTHQILPQRKWLELLCLVHWKLWEDQVEWVFKSHCIQRALWYLPFKFLLGGWWCPTFGI